MKAAKLFPLTPLAFAILAAWGFYIKCWWLAALFTYMSGFMWATIIAILERKKRLEEQERMMRGND